MCIRDDEDENLDTIVWRIKWEAFVLPGSLCEVGERVDSLVERIPPCCSRSAPDVLEKARGVPNIFLTLRSGGVYCTGKREAGETNPDYGDVNNLARGISVQPRVGIGVLVILLAN